MAEHPLRGWSTRGPWPSAITENFYERASNDPVVPQLWAYTDRWSYQPGDTVRLHVSTSLTHYDLEVWRDGGGGSPSWFKTGCRAPFIARRRSVL